jgi:hypothetical protein
MYRESFGRAEFTMSRAFVVLNRAHEIEFNLLNPYLIVPASPQFIFDHDGKRVPQGHGKVVITSNFVSAQCVNDN